MAEISELPELPSETTFILYWNTVATFRSIMQQTQHQMQSTVTCTVTAVTIHITSLTSSTTHHQVCDKCLQPSLSLAALLKVKEAISSSWKTYLNYEASPAIWDHTVLPATRHKCTYPTLTPASKLWYSIYIPWRDGRLSCSDVQWSIVSILLVLYCRL